MSTPEALTTEIQKLAPSAIVELFIVDATALGGDVLRFHAGTNGLKQNVVWQGATYVRFPVHVSGFEFNGQGQIPRPRMRVANLFSSITQVLLQFNGLLGAKVTRKRTMVKFLDAVNFAGGVNLTADSTAEFSEDIFYIDQKTSEDRDTVEFELASAMDLAGVQLPRRQIIQNSCVWAYRGSECGYAGPPFWDANDNGITTATSSQGHTLIAARAALLSAEATLATAETALAAAAATMGTACDSALFDTQYDYTYSNAFAAYAVLEIGTSGALDAWWNSALVSLGYQYRVGTLQFDGFMDDGSTRLRVYKIEKWQVNSAACTAATTAYNSALTARNSAQTAVNTAQTNVDTAFAALPSNDPLYSAERCGKRLTSCKKRFGDTAELPFGSFPAAGLTR